jgi:UDP-galactopyranose mutase
MEYDFLIVGAGFFGSICARELTDDGYKCLVIDNRDHIGGNCYTEERDGINIHTYGPHIFHTSNKEVWEWINKYTEFNNFKLSPVANYKGEIYSLPFNMWTFNKLWGLSSPDEVIDKIKSESEGIDDPKNLEEQAIKFVGRTVYEKLIKGYTAKQWKKDPKLLPKDIIKRLPVRFTYDNNYFNDTYQGIPTGGYTKIFEKLLSGIDIKLKTDFFENKKDLLSKCEKVIYTGPIDKFYDYKFGYLEYKTTRFDHKKINSINFQGTPVMNFTDIDVQYTRIIEHKHFENSNTDVTWVTWEYPNDYDPEKTEPYYPVNDLENNEKYKEYLKLSKKENNIYFGGRLAEYKYYDMHQVIESALRFTKILKGQRTSIKRKI